VLGKIVHEFTYPGNELSLNQCQS